MAKIAVMTLVNIVATHIASLIFPLIKIEGFHYLVLAGLVLTIVNVSIRPLLLIISLPINIITMGLFTLVINTWMVMLADWFVRGIDIPGFWVSLAVAVLIIVLTKSLQRICDGGLSQK